MLLKLVSHLTREKACREVNEKWKGDRGNFFLGRAVELARGSTEAQLISRSALR